MTFLNHVPCKFKIVVDHIDNNKLNNNLNNLQLLTNRENSTKDSFNKCGYLGVSKSNKKFKASIRINGVAIYLGSFDTAKLAHEKYKSARIKHEINNLHK